MFVFQVARHYLPCWGLARALCCFSSSAFIALFVLVALSSAAVVTTSSIHTPTGGSCEPSLGSMEIRYKNCTPMVVPVLACTGRCESYARPDPNNPIVLQRDCQCCSELERVERYVRLRCPSPNDPHQVELFRFPLSFPRNCACRPCSS